MKPNFEVRNKPPTYGHKCMTKEVITFKEIEKHSEKWCWANLMTNIQNNTTQSLPDFITKNNSKWFKTGQKTENHKMHRYIYILL